MKAFVVFENRQASDHDGWKFWITKYIISYHTSIEGANSKIAILTNELDNKINSMIIYEGSGGEHSSYKKYDIYEIEIEP